ncbi:MFS transporter [Bacillus sp. SA1-12]|uniref:MFS transporter n=1 Tax=Bacillus sp. SA1-12 TaxID=1455638 RepID=UPI00062721BA|nr:MFS transporter [Bacillus sp. SA1-12]KKI89275.1 MFS transporter [Bacillus sp. SA1-12]
MFKSVSSSQSKQIFGLPIALIWGYVAIAFFMTGDGIEQAFLSKYIVDLGFSTQQASLVFTVYGLTVAIAAWLSGVTAEIIGPRRIMIWGFVLWIIFHIGFITLGLEQKSYAMMITMYGIRGIAYPMFIYGFVVWIAYAAPKQRLASAMGWFWCMYSVGMGVFGSYLPSFSIPMIGFMGTLWMAIAFIAIGGLMVMFLIKDNFENYKNDKNSNENKFREILRGITLAFENPQITMASVVRIINQISLYGFVVILPIVFTDQIGYTMSEWLRIWGAIYATTIFTNLMWGLLGDRIGWVRQVRWFGCIGMAIATLLFYYLPMSVGPNLTVGLFVAIVFGIAIAAFVPMSAIFPTLEPNHKGAAVSMHNLSAGLSNFVGPALATAIMPLAGVEGVVWAFTVLYIVGFIITFFMKVNQPANGSNEDSQPIQLAK